MGCGLSVSSWFLDLLRLNLLRFLNRRSLLWPLGLLVGWVVLQIVIVNCLIVNNTLKKNP